MHDELDIPYGALRAKFGGGDNGHNGLRSITKSLGTRDYLRVRFGVGRPPGRMDPAVYVLRDFATAERKDLPLLVDRAADVVESLHRRRSGGHAEQVSTAPTSIRRSRHADRPAPRISRHRRSTCRSRHLRRAQACGNGRDLITREYISSPSAVP